MVKNKGAALALVVLILLIPIGSLFSYLAPQTGEEVSLSPAMTAISYELAGHPVRESYTFTPSQHEGSWKLLAMAMGLEPLEPRGRGW